MNSDVQWGLAVHAPLVTPIMLLLKDMIITYQNCQPLQGTVLDMMIWVGFTSTYVIIMSFNSNMIGVTSGAWTASPPWTSEFIPTF
jgi:hypothetical protein